MKRPWIFLAGAIAGIAVTTLAFVLPMRTDWLDWDVANLRRAERVPETLGRHPIAMENIATAMQAETQPTTEAQTTRSNSKSASRSVPSVSETPGKLADKEPPSPEGNGTWDTLVGGVLEDEVARRLGRQLDPVQQQRLLDKLAQLRYASLDLQEDMGDAQDPATLRARLSHTLAILQADQAFREELGIGIATFLQGLDADAVEDVAPARNKP